jgi:hypothetical protein
MARPKKNNADYFSHDSNMRDHRKIKALRANFGHLGYSIFNMLLETLAYSENLRFKNSDIEIEFLAGDFQIEKNQLIKIIEYLEKIGLIKNEHDYIYSPGMIDRLDGLLSKRAIGRVSAPETLVSAPETLVSAPETLVSDSQNPQSKVKIKIKERKLERKGKENIIPLQVEKQLAVKESKTISCFIKDKRPLEIKWLDYTPSYILTNAYYFYWGKVYGRAPVLNFAKVQKQFQNMAELLKHPEIFNAMIKYFCDRSDWLINNKHPLDIFIKNPNKYIGGEQTEEFRKLSDEFYSVERQKEYENYKQRRKEYVSKFTE